MTYGEYYYLLKNDMKLKDGVWVAEKPKGVIPSKMSKKEAVVYYTKKLNQYWIKTNRRPKSASKIV